MDKVVDRLHKLLSLRGGLENSKLAKAFSSSELALPHNFIEALLNSWRSLSERAHERQKIHGHVSLCLGIAASHWFISNEKFVSLPDADITHISQDAEIIDMDVATNPDNPAPKASNTTKYKRYICELIDHSEGGFCLKWLQEIPTQLQCGEIVALEKEVRPGKKTWIIGTIRWLKNEEDQTILIGIQMLSPEVIPVKSCLSNTHTGHMTPTLLFPEQPQSEKPMTLITPSLPFKTGQEIDIEYEQQIFPVCLQKSYSLSPSYQEFGLEFLHQRLVVPPDADVEQLSSTATTY
jgi:hypothetical protein